ncbi:MAG: aminotransferase class III-fold pyridoxal phosphate-dependent enzyme, partial [Clostridia bacterium]|nr:aminotransferase class III-fold pyridoxal phosphate-dependent enzyme [Clostridia bacterium]
VRGEGGVMPLSCEFAEEIKAVCAENDLLMIIDEVQTGNGRTGSLFCYEQYGFTPDIVSTAKGLAGGLPLGATMFGEKTAEVYTPGSHGSTFGGNPVCAAAANSIIDRLTEELFASVKAKSEKITAALSGIEGVKSISGKGLMLGILTEKSAKDIVAEAREKGLLILTAKDRVRLLPPLNISDEALDKGIEILKEVIK